MVPVKALEEIIRDCQEGRPSARQYLYEKFSPVMFAICLRYSRDRTEAEDLLHEGFLKVFRSIGDFRGEGSLEGWMRRIMVNTALEQYRRKNYLYPVENLPEEEAGEAESPDMQLRSEDLQQMIRELPPRYRMVFNLYALEGYSHKEIAKMMGITTGTSKSNLSRAREILQRKVEAQYGILRKLPGNYEQRG